MNMNRHIVVRKDPSNTKSIDREVTTIKHAFGIDREVTTIKHAFGI